MIIFLFMMFMSLVPPAMKISINRVEIKTKIISIKIREKFLKKSPAYRPIILQNEKRKILRVCDWIHLGYNNLLSLDDDKYTATRKIW